MVGSFFRMKGRISTKYPVMLCLNGCHLFPMGAGSYMAVKQFRGDTGMTWVETPWEE